MDVVYLDGLPYPDPEYLRRRIAAKEAEAERWRARARQHESRSSSEGRELVRAYLLHARVAEMDAARRRDTLAEIAGQRAMVLREAFKTGTAATERRRSVEAFA
jgi:hypothetical protein